MPRSAVHGTPIVQDMNAEVEAEVERITALQLRLEQQKQHIVQNNMQHIPLPSGVVLAWKDDLPFNEWMENTSEYRYDYVSKQCDNCQLYFKYKEVSYRNNQICDVQYHECPACGTK